MNLSISNIAWDIAYDDLIYGIMIKMGFMGLEIAPTRIFPVGPYDHLCEAADWKDKIGMEYGLKISSIQSIWYGRNEMMFGNSDERKALILYTKKAIEFAEVIGCPNLVFGCPKNRSVSMKEDAEIAVDFFRTVGDYAFKHNTTISMEANPTIYNTNFINFTKDAIDIVERVNSKGFLLNLDVGTMIENKESAEILNGKEHLINHVHISEPGLKTIKKRSLHRELAEILRNAKYGKYVSIEVGRQENPDALSEMMEYVREIFG